MQRMNLALSFSKEHLSLWGAQEKGYLGQLGSSREGGNTCHVFLLCVQNHVETHDLDLEQKAYNLTPKCLE